MSITLTLELRPTFGKQICGSSGLFYRLQGEYMIPRMYYSTYFSSSDHDLWLSLAPLGITRRSQSQRTLPTELYTGSLVRMRIPLSKRQVCFDCLFVGIAMVLPLCFLCKIYIKVPFAGTTNDI